MKRHHHLILSGSVAAAVLCLTLTGTWAGSATAGVMNVAGGEVNVSVGFSTQMPLDDATDQTLARTQKRGHTFIYRMAKEECAVLKASIAETCRLASLNVSAQLRNPYNNRPVSLYLNGNAQYFISLKKF